MPARRVHTKSRYGCDQCRKRRVKCDEREPICTNCVTRDAKCQYSRTARIQQSHSGVSWNYDSQSPTSVEFASPSFRATANSLEVGRNMHECIQLETSFHNTPFCPSTRQRELELMQYWFTKTCHSFTSAHVDLFRGYVTAEALNHPYLMDSIFALTSVHIASETSDPVSAASYVSMALQYQNNAVPTFCAALHNVTQSNCGAIFMSSILTMACSIVAPLLPVGDNDAEKSPIKSMLLLHDLLNGIRSVISLSAHWLKSSPCGEILRPKCPVELLSGQETIFPIKQLKSLNNTVIEVSNPSHETNQHAIEQLERCFAEGKTTPVAWLALAGEEFVEELRRGKRMALMIFMYWGVLLDRLDEMWWAKYSGKKLVEELCGSFNGYGNEWDEATKWAMVEVKL